MLQKDDDNDARHDVDSSKRVRRRQNNTKKEDEEGMLPQSFVKLVLSMGCFSGATTHLGSGDDDDDQEDDLGEPLDPPHPLDGVPATYAEANSTEFHRQQQMEQMKKSEVVFLTEFRKMMTSGFRLVLFRDRRPTTLKLENDAVTWQGARSDARLVLRDLKRVGRGSAPTGEILLTPKTKHRVPEEDRCFFLEAKDTHSPVFETVDRETRELIVDGFDLLVRETLGPAPL